MKKVYLHKAKTQIARPNTIRDINRQIVLNYVRDLSPISRADIARETALQRSTVSAIVEDLQAVGLIEEIGTGDSTGGRKPTLLKIRTGAPVAVGVDVTPSRTTVAVADLAGEIVESEVFPTVSCVVSMTGEIVNRVAELAKKYRNHELEVGVSVPGIIDTTTNKVLHVPFFQWRDWNIGELIHRESDLRVTVENDANAVAWAELWFGGQRIRNIRNFITVLVAEGIGTGIVFDGQIYSGEKGAAGEFGHMIVGFDAPVQCSCGSFDCWEAHTSDKAFISRYRKFSGDSAPENGSAAEIVNLARGGEPAALQALKETANYLGIGISNLIVGLSPQAVIVSGNITRAWNLIADDLYALARRSVRQDLPKPAILASSLGDRPTLIGALSLVLARKFAIPNKG